MKKKKFKMNRSVLAVICILLALAITFGLAPMVNRLTSDTITVLRLKQNVSQGNQISMEMLEAVDVKTETLPANIVSNAQEIVGKYAASKLYAGDYLTEDKLNGDSTKATDIFAKLNGSKVAMSIPAGSFTGGMIGKLQNGDIVSCMVMDKHTGTAYIPGELKYLYVVTTTTSSGVDQDAVVVANDGSHEMPSSITFLVDIEQAKLLTQFSSGGSMQCILVYRGDMQSSQKFIDLQDSYLSRQSAVIDVQNQTAETAGTTTNDTAQGNNTTISLPNNTASENGNTQGNESREG